MRQTETERFWRKVDRLAPDECWNWTAFRQSIGYGTITFRGRVGMLAHRASWILNRGPIPEGACVLHKCDNRACVNPDHLYIGDQADNARDRESRGRGNSRCGEQKRNAKLMEIDVLIMRRLYSEGVSSMALASLYGVTYSTAKRVVAGKVWRHLLGRAA